MEDYKYLLYIAASILYFIFKGIGKNKKQSAPKSTGEDRSPAKSFQEILAEMTGGQAQSDETIEEEDPREYETSLETAASRPLEQTVSDEEYARADDTLKELYKKGEKLKTITELVDINEVTTTSQFDAYDEEEADNDLAAEIRDDFSNPTTAKKAFIYSEIFNRKY